MKRITLFLLLMVVTSALLAEVCWGNGSTMYQGTFIYNAKSIVTQDNDLYLCWAEKEDGIRKLKLQKTDYNGNPLWTQPQTLVESSSYMGVLGIYLAGQNTIYLRSYNEEIDGYMLYCLNFDGVVQWQTELPGNFKKQVVLDDGSIIIFHDYYDLHASYYNAQGAVIWDNILLPGISSGSTVEAVVVIDDFLRVVSLKDQNISLHVYDSAGNQTAHSTQYFTSAIHETKFMDGKFYTFFPEEDLLKMWCLDENGFSLTGDEPQALCTLDHGFYTQYMAGNGYFYGVNDDDEDFLAIQKFDYSGNSLASYIYPNGSSDMWIAYDQEDDFIAVYQEENGEYLNYILPVTADGFGNTVEFNNFLFEGVHAIQNGYTWCGAESSGTEALVAERADGTVNHTEILRQNEKDLFTPRLVKETDGLSVYWSSNSRDSLMTQKYNESGQPQYQANGKAILPVVDSWYADDTILFSYGSKYNPSGPDTLFIQAYNTDGTPLWPEAYEYVLDYNYLDEFTVSPFYDGYVFYGMGYGDEVTDLIMIKILPSGPAWNQPLIQPMPLWSCTPYIQSNTLFYSQDSLTKAICAIQEDGTLGQPLLVNAYPNPLFQGDETDAFAIYKEDEEYKIYYLHEGQIVWQTPLIVDYGNYTYLQVSATEDGVTIAGYEYGVAVHVTTYDLQQNPIPSQSFTYTSLNSQIYELRMMRNDDVVVLCFASQSSDVQFTYAILAPDGTVQQPESAEPLMSRPDMEHIEDMVVTDDAIYLALSCGYKPFEGEFEREHFVQKIDITTLVGTDPQVVPPSQDVFSMQVHPNPFNPSTSFSFALPQDAKAEISVFNCRGQRVKTLVNDFFTAGTHAVVWNGQDDNDVSVGSGIYFYRLSVDGMQKTTGKCLLLK